LAASSAGFSCGVNVPVARTPTVAAVTLQFRYYNEYVLVTESAAVLDPFPVT
jgi:hypothetical protein